MDTKRAALEEAIRKAGSQRALAELLDLTPPSITGWILRGYVPAARVVEVEQKTGVPRWQLCPELYSQPDAKPGK